MKEIPLTQGKVALVDDADFERLNQFKWFAAFGGGIEFYAKRMTIIEGKRKVLRMHRVILGLMDNPICCDHIDGNGLNNQRNNLRLCTRQENNRNVSSRRDSISKYKGVSSYKKSKKWRSFISVDGKYIHLGYFHSEKDAALAHNEAALKYHGEFARLNTIKD